MPEYDVRAIAMPYCIKRTEDGRYRLLNRNYKPLGFFQPQMVNYDDFPIAIPIEGITQKVAKQLSHNQNEDLNEIFLYNDGSNPISNKENMDAYLKRLETLMSMSVSVVDKT